MAWATRGCSVCWSTRPGQLTWRMRLGLNSSQGHGGISWCGGGDPSWVFCDGVVGSGVLLLFGGGVWSTLGA